ncbi:MAG: precorrin-6A reductase [Eubacterium sp.]|nr:precorrin-6A reductase [Eubacterium sp.]
MMTDVFLFAGTIEGKELAEALCGAGTSVHAFTATEYGGELLNANNTGADESAEADVTQDQTAADVVQDQTTADQTGRLCVTSERLDEEQMLALMQEEKPGLVIDATHPYAVVVSDNIRRATQEAGIALIRLQRRESLQQMAGTAVRSENIVHVASAEAAADFLAQTQGNVLLTCGSKELPAFTKLEGYEERLYARVLSTENVVCECAELGFTGKHLIAMQGPFSLEMNRALIRHIDAAWLVTKESGVQGGFPEKAQAAAEEGIGLIIIDRPGSAASIDAGQDGALLKNITPAGYFEKYMVCDTVASCLREVYQFFGITPKKKFTLLGIGPGSAGGLTLEGKQALEEADVVFGATRMLEILDKVGLKKPTFKSWKPEEMKQFADENPQYQNVVVALSGDTGFYSGAAKLLEVWKDEEVRVLPGLSTLQVLCAKAKTDWQHVYCISRHGRAGNLLSALRTQEALFLLPGETLPELCEKLIGGGYDRVTLAVGSKLSYADETVLIGTPDELKNETVDAPYAVLIKNPAGQNAVVTPGIPDADFLRVMAGTKQAEAKVEQVGADRTNSGAEQSDTVRKPDKPKRTVPMTKEEVRTVSLAKLRLSKNAVVYDIGAGTGSVSVEAARMAYAGTVYAIEQNPAAVALLHENRKRFALDNMEIIEGLAPEAIEDLPAPTHAFIGGSKGNLKSIVDLLLSKNPDVRIVINTVTVETEMEARQVLEAMEESASKEVQSAADTQTEADMKSAKAAGTGFQSEVIRLSVTREERVGRYHMQRAENPIAIISFGGAYE